MTGSSLHVVAGLGRSQGGPAYSVPRLCEALAISGRPSLIFSVESRDRIFLDQPRARFFRQSFAKVPGLGGLRLSEELNRALRQEARNVDIIHSHGLWLMPNVYAGPAARKAGKPLIVSPRGMLEPAALKFSRWKKKAFWSAFQRSAYADAAVWHATSQEEARNLRTFGVNAPIAIIPNGVDAPDAGTVLCAEGMRRQKRQRTVVFLSRIHPKKGLPDLIRAWAHVAHQHSEWRLRIIGPDEGGHAAELRQLSQHLGATQISIENPVYGLAKSKVLSEADLFVLPTLSENFGIAVAEALAFGVPAIVTKGAPWRGLTAHDCGWWVKLSVEELASSLKAAMTLSVEERIMMGRRGRAFVLRDFSWDTIASDMAEVYIWASTGCLPPACLTFDEPSRRMA